MKKSNDILKKEISQWLENDATPVEKQSTEDAILRFAEAYAVSPDPSLKEKIMDKIRSLNAATNHRQPLSLENLPLLSASSNWLDWQEVVKDIRPPDHFNGIHLHNLESSPQRELFVAWVKEYVDEEVHTDIIESFILLQGTCECHITDEKGNARVVRMSAGDYITMNTGEIHDVIITSLEPAKAILQWLKLSA